MTRISAIGVVLAWVGVAGAEVRIEEVEYRGWSGCFRISNRQAELIYVPRIGRIMRFARQGSANVLWENVGLSGSTPFRTKPGQWVNYGGDKIWPAPQSLWGWPPDPMLDGAPYPAHIEGQTLVITGQASAKSGVRFTRRITLDANRPIVKIENQMFNTASVNQELALWQITQVDNPDIVTVPIEVTKEMPNGWEPYDNQSIDGKFATVKNGVLEVHRNTRGGFKLGSASRKGILTAKFGKTTFSTSVKKLPGKYVDGGKFLEVYASGDPLKYVELELTGPLKTLKPGEHATQTVTWKLEN